MGGLSCAEYGNENNSFRNHKTKHTAAHPTRFLFPCKPVDLSSQALTGSQKASREGWWEPSKKGDTDIFSSALSLVKIRYTEVERDLKSLGRPLQNYIENNTCFLFGFMPNICCVSGGTKCFAFFLAEKKLSEERIPHPLFFGTHGGGGHFPLPLSWFP